MTWRKHPTWGLEADESGAIRRSDDRRRVKTRPDKDGYSIFTTKLDGEYRTLKAHRIVLACFEGEQALEVDHVNRDRTDNRYANLRYATVSENRRNVGVKKESSTQVRCVRWRKDRQVYQAYCNRDGRFVHLGHFADLSAARIVAEAHYHG